MRSRILAVLAALATVLGVAFAAAPAAGASTSATVGIGPECAPNVVSAVLSNVAGTALPGSVIQYFQITTLGTLQLCVVHVP